MVSWRRESVASHRSLSKETFPRTRLPGFPPLLLARIMSHAIGSQSLPGAARVCPQDREPSCLLLRQVGHGWWLWGLVRARVLRVQCFACVHHSPVAQDKGLIGSLSWLMSGARGCSWNGHVVWHPVQSFRQSRPRRFFWDGQKVRYVFFSVGSLW